MCELYQRGYLTAIEDALTQFNKISPYGEHKVILGFQLLCFRQKMATAESDPSAMQTSNDSGAPIFPHHPETSRDPGRGVVRPISVDIEQQLQNLTRVLGIYSLDSSTKASHRPGPDPISVDNVSPYVLFSRRVGPPNCTPAETDRAAGDEAENVEGPHRKRGRRRGRRRGEGSKKRRLNEEFLLSSPNIHPEELGELFSKGSREQEDRNVLPRNDLETRFNPLHQDKPSADGLKSPNAQTRAMAPPAHEFLPLAYPSPQHHKSTPSDFNTPKEDINMMDSPISGKVRSASQASRSRGGSFIDPNRVSFQIPRQAHYKDELPMTRCASPRIPVSMELSRNQVSSSSSSRPQDGPSGSYRHRHIRDPDSEEELIW